MSATIPGQNPSVQSMSNCGAGCMCSQCGTAQVNQGLNNSNANQLTAQPMAQDAFMSSQSLGFPAAGQSNLAQDPFGGVGGMISQSTLMLMTQLSSMMLQVTMMVNQALMMLLQGQMSGESDSSGISSLMAAQNLGMDSHAADDGHDHSHETEESNATTAVGNPPPSNGELGLPIDPQYFKKPGRDFGSHLHPIDGVHKHHNGADFSAPTGTPLYAVADGTLSFKPNNGGAGNTADVTLSDGTKFRYFHLDGFEGEERTVKKGDIIGYVGSTGKSTGPHLHFEYHPPGTSGAAVWPLFQSLV